MGHGKAAPLNGAEPHFKVHSVEIREPAPFQILMIIIISRYQALNLLNFIERKHFLEKLFPNGLVEKMVVPQIHIDSFGYTAINVHVRQKPAISVSKWGVWGEDYNTIVIKLIGSNVARCAVTNIQNATYADVNITDCGGRRILSQQAESWSLELEFECFIFQRCEIYLDS